MTTSEAPRISVLLPVYNGARYLDEAIESVLRQGFGDFELIVVDDASTDETPAILARWAARDPRIVLLRNATNGGVSVSLNVALAAARGQYVARQDADDVSLPDRFLREVEVLDSRPEVVLVSTNYAYMDWRGRVQGRTMIAKPPDVLRWRFLFSNAIGGHSQVMFRTDVARAIGGYSVVTVWSEDYDLWTRLMEHGEVVVLPMVGMKHRLHDGRSSVIWRAEQRAASYSITRRMLTGLLVREVSDDELVAVSHLWRLEFRRGYGRRADRVVREAFRVFARTHSAATSRRVRMLNGRQFAIVAAFLIRRGWVVDAAMHVVRGLRWHPLGVIQSTWYLGHLTAYRLLRLVRP